MTQVFKYLHSKSPRNHSCPVFELKHQFNKYAALLRPPMEIKRLFFHFKTSYNKTDTSVFNLTDI